MDCVNRILFTSRRNGSKTIKPVIAEMLAHGNLEETICIVDNSDPIRSKVFIRMPLLID